MREGAETTTFPHIDFPPHFPNTKEMFMGGNGGGSGSARSGGGAGSGAGGGTGGGGGGGGGKGSKKGGKNGGRGIGIGGRRNDKFSHGKELVPAAGVRG